MPRRRRLLAPRQRPRRGRARQAERVGAPGSSPRASPSLGRAPPAQRAAHAQQGRHGQGHDVASVPGAAQHAAGVHLVQPVAPPVAAALRRVRRDPSRLRPVQRLPRVARAGERGARRPRAVEGHARLVAPHQAGRVRRQGHLPGVPHRPGHSAGAAPRRGAARALWRAAQGAHGRAGARLGEQAPHDQALHGRV